MENPRNSAKEPTRHHGYYGRQDTPWIQTGPRINVLKNSDMKGQTAGTSVACNASDWDCLNFPAESAADIAAFGKWGQSGIGDIGNIAPVPESFGLMLSDATYMANEISFVDLETTNAVVLTYQCLCKVTGQLVFKLVNSGDAGTVYDQVVIGEAGATTPTSPTLVTLRLQRQTDDDAGTPVLWVQNASGDDAVWQVFWQQAWAGGGDTSISLEDGLRNAAQIRTPVGEETTNTFVWGVNATSVRAVGRFQFPLLDTDGDAAGMGWQSPEALADEADLADGEAYMDAEQVSLMGRAASKWYTFVQPDVIGALADGHTWEGGDVKNVVYDSISAATTLNLSTSVTEVPRGAVVRVFNLVFTIGANVLVKVGGTTLSTVQPGNKMSEFLFYVDGSNNGHWLVTQNNVASGRLP